MELAFLTSAIRRYFWIVVLGAVIGALPGLYLAFTSEELYESRAVLLIAPPTQARATSDTYQGDPDRYVAGELSVLESLSDQVANSIDGESAGDIGANVTFEQQPLTDVVVVIAKAPTPELAQEIAQGYVDEYFVVLRDQLDGTEDPAIEEITQELTLITEDLADVDRRAAAALSRWIEGPTTEAVPTIEQVAPALASEKAGLVARYNDLQTTRSELEAGLRVSSRTIREANLPTEPVASSSRMLVLLGAVAGAFIGLLAAVITARLSRSVLDDEQAEEILGHDLVGAMPDWPAVGASRTAVLDPPGAEVEQFLDSLGVRVEAVGQGAGTVTAVVCGVRSNAGSTTLAASLALQLASPEVTVLLVDADRHHPEVTSLLGGGADGRADVEVVDTTVKNLQFVTLAGLTTLASALSGDRRPNAELQLSVASTYADVVIVDGGALMGSASTVQLTRACDVTLLAIPLRQSIRGLETVSNELRSRDHLLPVWVPVSEAKHRDGESADEPVEAEARDTTTTRNEKSRPSKDSPTAASKGSSGSGSSSRSGSTTRTKQRT